MKAIHLVGTIIHFYKNVFTKVGMLKQLYCDQLQFYQEDYNAHKRETSAYARLASQQKDCSIRVQLKDIPDYQPNFVISKLS